MQELLRDFFYKPYAGGVMLILAALLALIVANSPWVIYYNFLLDIPVAVQVGEFEINKPILLWINDGLMAIFFFVVGLELKREVMDGHLSSRDQIALPAIGALGGIIVPALIYSWFNWGNPEAMKGWAIPVATDIAFALGVLTLLGNRVPTSLKVFLVSLAIFDDISAVIIIALFYTSNLSTTAMLVAGSCLLILLTMNIKGRKSIGPYLFFGLILWASVLKSGVHATLAGVALAMFIPYKNRHGGSPVKELEHDLHPVVTYQILPIFAFANAGVAMAGMGLSDLVNPVPLGIALGLFLGKPLGILALIALCVMIGLVRLPKGVNWMAMTGVSILCGIGFTMSLFIGGLAFDGTQMSEYLIENRVGILMGTLLSAVVGYLVLFKALPRPLESS